MSKAASGRRSATAVAAGGVSAAGVGAGRAGEGAAVTGAARGTAAASLDRVRMTVPSLTRSPTLTFSSPTTPLSGDGTSIEALSDSNVLSGCSGLTISPGLTHTSITGTALKSPISGTRTSATPLGALVGAGGDVTAGFIDSTAEAPSSSSDSIGAPWLTLSPIFTASDLTKPVAGDGTSIEALSDSSVMSGASAVT